MAILFLTTAAAATTGCGDDGAADTDAADSDGTGTGGNNSSDLGTDLGSTGGGDGGGGEGGGECGGDEVTADPVVANVLLVIDKSGSMEATPDGFTESKWDTLVASLESALDAVKEDIQMGLALYPSGDTESDVCAVQSSVAVDVGPGETAVTQISGVLSETTPDGQTPTAAALALALEYFTEGSGAELDGDAFVVLATDGGPNCGADDRCVPEAGCQPDDTCGLTQAETCTINIEDCGGAGCPAEGSYCLEASQCLDDAETLAGVTALADAGIATIVVGMPGSEAYQEVLDALAVAGGRPAQLSSPKYHKVDDAEGLSQTLEDITRGVIRSCDILAETPPPDPAKVNVFLDGEAIPQDSEDGWRFGDETTTFIQIVGSYCEQIEQSGAESISVEYGCPTLVVK